MSQAGSPAHQHTRQRRLKIQLDIWELVLLNTSFAHSASIFKVKPQLRAKTQLEPLLMSPIFANEYRYCLEACCSARSVTAINQPGLAAGGPFEMNIKSDQCK